MVGLEKGEVILGMVGKWHRVWTKSIGYQHSLAFSSVRVYIGQIKRKELVHVAVDFGVGNASGQDVGLRANGHGWTDTAVAPCATHCNQELCFFRAHPVGTTTRRELGILEELELLVRY